MRVVFAGTPQVAVPSLESLLHSRHDVVAVLTRPDAPAGRGRRVASSAVAARAEHEGIEVLRPSRPGDQDFAERLAAIAPDCCPVVAYGALIPQKLLDVPAYGWVNLHFSLLPAWRGAAPVQRALMAGDDVTGATTFRIVRELDAGPTYGLCTEVVRADDTAGTLLDRLAVHGAGLLTSTLDHLEQGDLVATPQPDEGVSLAPKVEVDDARVRWGAPALDVDRRIRACTPAPGAWTTLGPDRLKLGPVRLLDSDELEPGVIQVDKHEVRVGTATVDVALGGVQPPGKRAMPASAWARGVRLAPGTVLGLGTEAASGDD
ncbi:MAG: methionyl-tRNA formyltransferase [Nocardioidaceae bacterium]